jgi:hypothetical protein
VVAADAAGAARAARGLITFGASNAIVTLGIHGAVLVTADGAWTVDGVPARERGPFTVGRTPSGASPPPSPAHVVGGRDAYRRRGVASAGYPAGRAGPGRVERLARAPRAPLGGT